MRVLILTEYYPRAADPASGIWVHRQALAAQAAGAQVQVLVLHRPIPSRESLRRRDGRALLAPLRQPRSALLDGVPVRYLSYLSPPRPLSYGSWGAWAAPALRIALAGLRRRFDPQLIHAHYAIPAGDAARRLRSALPLLISVHGHDVLGAGAGGANVRRALSAARLVLANSRGTAERCLALGAGETRVVHLGAPVPTEPRPLPPRPTLVTLAHLVARKRHADVIEAVALLRRRHPDLRYLIIGDGPERSRLAELAALRGVEDRVEMCGALAHRDALRRMRSATLLVLPSVQEAFGVAYIEAMAAGMPAVGSRGEPGPEEIARSGPGLELVPPGDPAALAARLDGLLSRPEELRRLGRLARDTVQEHFTWERCGAETVRAYADAMAAPRR